MKRIVEDLGGNTLILVLPPLAVTFLMWLTRLNEVPLLEFLAAAGLLAAAWIPYARWRMAGERYLPILPMLSLMFWVYYVLPLFWGDRRAYTLGHLSEQSVEQALLLAVMGVACLWLGKWTGVGRRLGSRRMLDIHYNHENAWLYIRAALLLTIPLMFVIESSAYVFGAGGRQFLIILASGVPMALFVLLFRKLLRRQASHPEVLLIGVFLVGRLAAGLGSGWLGASVGILIICGVAYLYERRRIPTSAVLVVLAFVLFFQAGKGTFRKTFWGERVDSTLSQRISFWSSESLRSWELAFHSSDTDNWRLLANQSLGRMSLLQQTAHMLELTPDEVPYQHGRLYSYMFVTFIPRAIWPDKPSVNDANRFYQVAYGLTTPEHLNGVSIAIGTLAESFINFGWWGPFLVMIPLGIFFDYFQHSFLARDSGWVMNAIGISIIPHFLAIEGQMAEYLGGVVQCIAVILFVLWPVLHVQLRGRNSTQAATAEFVNGGLQMSLPVPRRFL